MFDRLWINARAATFDPARPGPYGLIKDAAIAARDGRLSFVGEAGRLAGAPPAIAREVIDLDGRLVTPGLIDCHTHLVFAGDRATEFERRLAGASYADIAAEGGGILSTVRATRAASVEALVEASLPRLDALIADGATTVEIKSGYGLDLDTELKMLEAAGELGRRRRVRIKRTLLAAHAVPPEYAHDRAGYLDLICERIIPEAAARGLADAVDAYGEHLAFSPEEVERVFVAARAHGLAVKLHADQLSDQGGGALAARFAALSADHVEYLNDEGVAAMAAAGTTAVLLPGAFVSLRETRKPPIDALRAAGVAMAVATDANPGTSPLLSPKLAASLACLHFGLTVEEALAGLTRRAARALGLSAQTGVLREGLAADLAIWDVRSPAELVYWMGERPLRSRAFAGEPD